MFCKELVNYQNNLYWVYRKVKEHQVKPDNITLIRDYWGCDIVLKQNNTQEKYLLFLILIPEAEVLEFTPNRA
jgi:hypothetical protein